MRSLHVYFGGLFVLATRGMPEQDSVYAVGVDATTATPPHKFRVLLGVDAYGENEKRQLSAVDECDFEVNDHSTVTNSVIKRGSFKANIVSLHALGYGQLHGDYLDQSPAKTVARGGAIARFRTKGGDLTTAGGPCNYAIVNAPGPPTTFDVPWAPWTVWRTQIPDSGRLAELKIVPWNGSTPRSEILDPSDSATWPSSGPLRIAFVNEPSHHVHSLVSLEHYKVIMRLTTASSGNYPFLENDCTSGPGGSPSTCPGTKDP